MTLAADIKTTLAGVVTTLDDGGWSWAAASAPTTWTPVAAVAVGLREEIDPGESDEVRYAQQTIRIAVSATMPQVRDRFKDAANLEWEVTSVQSSGYGTRSYLVQRGTPLTLGAQRERVRR